MSDPRDIALGLTVTGMRAGVVAFRLALLPARVALRTPVVGPPARRIARDLAHQGALARGRGQARLEAEGNALLAGPLTDAIAHAIAEHHVVERIATEIVATADLDGLMEAVLEHDRTQQVLERALLSPGLERLVVQVLESHLVDALTERVLVSPELDRVVEYVATSPQVLDAVTRQTQSLAEEMAAGVRRRTHAVDDAAERTIRGWLRRPRPQTS